MAISAINLVVLRSQNPRSLTEFYKSLGLDFVLEKHGSGPEHHSSSIGDSVLEIYPCTDSALSTKGTRIGFTVSSLNDVLSGLGGNHELISKPRETPWGKRCVLQDPEGHKIELIERLEAA